MRRFALLVVGVAVATSCKREEVGTVVGPGLTIELRDGGREADASTSGTTDAAAHLDVATDDSPPDAAGGPRADGGE